MTRDEWLASLDQERFNVAYREIKEPRVRVETLIRTVIKPCRREHLTSKARAARDQIMFNAGRYAAGARDHVAVDAHEQLMTLLEEK